MSPKKNTTTDDTSEPTDDFTLAVENLQTFSEEFDDLCQLRHDIGSKEYGPTKFLSVDLYQYAAEELADLSNYARFLYVKLRTIEELLNASGINLSAQLTEEVRSTDPVPPHASTFIPSGEISGFLPSKK